MNNFLKMIGVLAVTVIIPLVILLAIWMDLLPQIVQLSIAQAATYASIFFIVGGTLFLIYSDIKTKRYAKA